MLQPRPPTGEQQEVLAAIVTLLGENRRERLAAQQEKTNEHPSHKLAGTTTDARLLRTRQTA
jgi:hypothetical protein